MSEFTHIELKQMTDDAIIARIGEYVRQQRLQQNLKQQSLADQAGINRSTLYELEQGKRVTLITLIQVLRALDRLEVLAGFKVSKEPSPIELARLKEKERKRATGKGDKASKSDW